MQKVQVSKANLNTKANISIDEIYLRRAFDIRVKFENIHLLISNKEKDISNLKKNIESLKGELIKAQKDIKQGDKTVLENVYRILDDLEFESQKLAKVIGPVEEKMEELRRDEVVLHQTLKEKYPHVTDDELKNVIIDYISNRKRDQ